MSYDLFPAGRFGLWKSKSGTRLARLYSNSRGYYQFLESIITVMERQNSNSLFRPPAITNLGQSVWESSRLPEMHAGGQPVGDDSRACLSFL